MNFEIKFDFYSLLVTMVVVFLSIGFAMVIMIAMIIPMRIRKGAHQFSVVLISLDALMADNVFR